MPSNMLLLKKTATDEERQYRHLQKSISIGKMRRNELIAKKRHVQEEELDSSLSFHKPEELSAFLEKCANDLKSDNISRYEKAIKRIRKILSNKENPPIDLVLNLDILPFIIKQLHSSTNESIQLEAAWTLTNIASGTTTQTYILVASGCQKEFIHLLNSTSKELKMQALWGLSNIQGDYSMYTPMFRKEFITFGGLDKVLQMISDVSLDTDILLIACTCIANVLKGKDEDPEIYSLMPYSSILSLFIPLLKQHVSNIDILSTITYGVSFLAEKSAELRDILINSSVIPILISLLDSGEKQILYPAFHTLSILISDNQEYTQMCIDANVIPAICRLLIDPRLFMKADVLYTVSNIAAGSAKQIQILIDSHIVDSLLSSLLDGSFDVRKEACWGLCNALCNCTIDQGIYIVDLGVISPLCAMLLPSLSIELYSLISETILVIIEFGSHKQIELGITSNPYMDQFLECDLVNTLETVTYRDAHLWKLIHDILDIFQNYNTKDDFNDIFAGF